MRWDDPLATMRAAKRRSSLLQTMMRSAEGNNDDANDPTTMPPHRQRYFGYLLSQAIVLIFRHVIYDLLKHAISNISNV
jgi:hypothetical protein